MNRLKSGRAQGILVACSAVAAVALTADAQRLSSDANVLNQKVLAAKRASEEAQTFKETDDQLGVSRSESANKLSEELEVACANTGVALKQVQFEPTTKPLGNGTEDAAASAWGLNHATILLEGTAPQVYQAMRQMSAARTVFRLDEISMSRVMNQAGSTGSVHAEVKIAVLVRKEGSS